MAKYSLRAGKQISSYSSEALGKLQAYPWPGNVRELENVVERALIVTRGPRVEAGDFEFARRAVTSSGPTAIVGSESSGAVRAIGGDGDASKPLGQRLLDEEKREIVAAIDRSQGNIAGAARLLGINRSTLYYRMRKHGLEHLRPTRIVVGDVDVEPATDS